MSERSTQPERQLKRLGFVLAYSEYYFNWVRLCLGNAFPPCHSRGSTLKGLAVGLALGSACICAHLSSAAQNERPAVQLRYGRIVLREQTVHTGVFVSSIICSLCLRPASTEIK